MTFYHEAEKRLEFLTKSIKEQRQKFVEREGKIEVQKHTFETQQDYIDAQNEEIGKFEVAFKNTTKWKKC